MPVPDYEAIYSVSNLGKLKRTATPTGIPRNRLIAPHVKRHGYADYWLWKDGLKTRIGAHRLVWLAFRGPIPPDLVINHKNGDKLDNRLSNLELATRSWNAAHSYRVLGRPAPNYPSPGVRNGSAVLDDEKVTAIRALYEAKSANQYDLAERFGVSQRTINLIVRRMTWRHIA